MSPKELMYIEDLKNPELKNYVTQLANQHQQLFQKLYGLM